MTEEKKDKYDEGEYDQEGDMAKSDLRSIMANAKELHDMIDDTDNLPEWCQNKITLAEDYISTVANYLTAEMNEEVESIDEEDAYEKDRYAVKNGKAVKDNPTHKGSSNYKDQPHHVYATSAEEALKKHMKKEEVEQIDEKNEPTNPSLWSRAKALARSKFDVYPSAYANGWASKWYKSKGGSWRSVSEATEPPFDKPYTTIKKVVTDKSGAKHSPMSRARDIARMAMKKQMEKMKPVKESLEESRKAEIVKEIMKKKKDKSEDAFQKDPELTTTLTKGI